jgi:hypothetical protein
MQQKNSRNTNHNKPLTFITITIADVFAHLLYRKSGINK